MDAQALADGNEIVDAEGNADWDDLFGTDVQEMHDGDFDNEYPLDELKESQVFSTASASGNKVHAMSDGSNSEATEDDDSTAHIQESQGEDQSAGLEDNEMEDMSLDDDKSDIPDKSDDSETDHYLKMMKAVDEKDSTDGNFQDFIDFIQTSDVDDARSDNERNHFQMRDEDYTKIMSEMEDTDDTTDDNFSEFLDMIESSDIDDGEEDSELDSLLDLAQRLFQQSPIQSEVDSPQESDHKDTLQTKSTMSSNATIHRRKGRHHKKPHKGHSTAHKKGKLFWKMLAHKFYYKKYRSMLKKYYRLRKRYYSLKSKCKKVLKGCKKTALKVVSDYCRKVHKKMNDYHKVHSKVRGCRDSKKCKFFEKTTTTTRSYYTFMYKMRPTAIMCSRLIKQNKG